MPVFNDDMYFSFLKFLEELQSDLNELEKDLQSSSNANMEKIKTNVLAMLTFIKLYPPK
jgi:hypothetical protein